MRKILTILFLVGTSLLSVAKDKKEKTFLVIFNKQELREHSTSSVKIELNFLDKFKTKAYSGNSDSALLITVPFEEWDTCDIGRALVIVGQDRLVKLEDIAFRIIDLNEVDYKFDTLLSKSSDDKGKKKSGGMVRVSL